MRMTSPNQLYLPIGKFPQDTIDLFKYTDASKLNSYENAKDMKK